MKNQIRYFIILFLVVNLIFISFTPTYACTPDIRSNYWYKLDYSVANDSLPSAIDAIGNHPPYDPSGSSYENRLGRESVLGQLEFTNESDSPAYIVPDDVLYNVDQYRESSRQYARAVVALADELAQDDGQIDLSTFSDTFSDHIIESNSSLIHRTYKGMQALMYNPQVPGRVESLPPPFLYESLVIQDNQRYTIPITVTYNLNSDYSEHFTAYGAPFEDYLINTDAIVLGEVIGAAEDAASYDGDNIYGYARVQVEEWLLGDGPAEIEVGRFSSSSLCEHMISVGMGAYFLLKMAEEPDSIRYPLTDSSRGNTVLTVNDRNAALINAALQEFVEPVATVPTALPTEDEPGMSIFLPYISR